MKKLIQSSIEGHQDIFTYLKSNLLSTIEQSAEILINAINEGGTIYWCGNGGSAADAEHLSAELLGRFNKERRSLPSIALTANTSVITSIGNDYGYDEVFSRQVEGLVKKGDVLIGISTSGNSKNVEKAIVKANELYCTTIGLLGRDGGVLADVCNLTLNVQGTDTARIQEMHILIGHILCEAIEVSVMNTQSQ